MLEIGPCDYVDELEPLSEAPTLTADSPVTQLQQEKALQGELLAGVVESAPPVAEAWAADGRP